MNKDIEEFKENIIQLLFDLQMATWDSVQKRDQIDLKAELEKSLKLNTDSVVAQAMGLLSAYEQRITK